MFSDHFIETFCSEGWPSDNPTDSPFNKFECKYCGKVFNIQVSGYSRIEEPLLKKGKTILRAHLFEHCSNDFLKSIQATNLDIIDYLISKHIKERGQMPEIGKWYLVRTKDSETWFPALYDPIASGGWTNQDTWEDFNCEVVEWKQINMEQKVDTEMIHPDEIKNRIDGLCKKYKILTSSICMDVVEGEPKNGWKTFNPIGELTFKVCFKKKE